MDENNTEFMDEFEDEVSFDPYDNDEAWDNIKWNDDEDETIETSEQSEGEAEEADQPESEEPEQTETDVVEDVEEEAADQWLELKHLDETRKVSKEEAKALAQKGMDYDRIREERDNLKSSLPRYQEMEKFLQEMQGDFDSIEEFMDDTRARVMADAEGISYSEALDRVQSSHAPVQPETKDNSGINVDAFVSKYPNVKAEDIPASVWADVQTTGDLVASYDKYEATRKSDRIAELEQEIEVLKNNKKNQARSAGSSKSSGVTGGKSLIASLWASDD